MIVNADCIEHLKTIEDNHFDSVVTDPPYHLTSIAKRFTNSTEAKYGKDGSFQRLSKGFVMVMNGTVVILHLQQTYGKKFIEQ